MLTQLSLLAALLSLADAKKDVEKIQGTWDVVKVLAAGEEAKTETADLKKTKIVIDADKIRFVKDKKSDFPMGYELDPTQKPKALDLGRFVTTKGIYALDVYDLKDCLDIQSAK